MDLSKSVLKHLRPLGHEFALWQEAINLLLTRLAKNRLAPELAAFVSRWLPQGGAPAPAPEEFELLLGQDAGGDFQLESSSVPFAANPVWWALLRLPALKGQWAADLRASHHDHLLTLLPRAWFIDPTPLPPGAAILGLEIPGWHGLPTLLESDCSFTLHNLDDGTTVGATPPNGRTLLVQRLTPVQQWRASYVKDDEGVHLRDAALTET